MKVALILLAVCAIFCQLFILDVLSIIWWFIPSVINLTFAALAYLWLRPRSSLLLASVGAVLVSVVLAFNVSLPRTVEHIWSNFALQSSGAKKAIFEIERGSKIYLDSKLQEVSYRSRAFNWPRYRSNLFPLITLHTSGERDYRYS